MDKVSECRCARVKDYLSHLNVEKREIRSLGQNDQVTKTEPGRDDCPAITFNTFICVVMMIFLLNVIKLTISYVFKRFVGLFVDELLDMLFHSQRQTC